MLADILVYNSSPNSPLLCILLSHWLSVIADVVFSQNTFHTAGFWIADRSRYLAWQISHGCLRLVGDSLRSCLCSFTLRDCHSREQAPICLWFRAFVGDFPKPVGEPKIGAKIVQSELGLTANATLLERFIKNEVVFMHYTDCKCLKMKIATALVSLNTVINDGNFNHI